MAGSSLAVIVASLHGRTGKTLLARTLADYFILSGPRPYIFDTDAVDRGLHALFPHDAFVVDLAIVPDEMLLFDTLAVRSARTRIVDVTHRSLITFFQLMRDSDFVSEARSCEGEPVIFYIPDRKVDFVRGRRGPVE
jgi:cellulose biosynthesis protein BcsQ